MESQIGAPLLHLVAQLPARKGGEGGITQLLPGGPQPLLQGAYILIEDLGLCHSGGISKRDRFVITPDSRSNAQPRRLRGSIREQAHYMIVGLAVRSVSMSCHSAIVLTLLLGGLIAPPKTLAHGVTLAQLTPPAGSAGAGNSAINGIPFGPANPSVLSDPSGIGNAARMPPLGTNAPAPPTSYGSVTSSPSQSSRSSVVTPSYASESPRFSARSVESRKPSLRRRGRS